MIALSLFVLFFYLIIKLESLFNNEFKKKVYEKLIFFIDIDNYSHLNGKL